MTTLAFDTALDNCSVAIGRDGSLLAFSEIKVSRGHAELLMPMIEKTMADAKITFDQIEYLVATVGPGTFAGVRVSVAAANSLALVVGCPLFGVTTLEAAAAKAVEDNVVGDKSDCFTIFISVGAGNIFSQSFKEKKDQTIYSLAPANRIEGRGIPEILRSKCHNIFVQPGSDIAFNPDQAVRLEPNAETLFLMSQRLNAKDMNGRIEPVYLRPPDATPGRGGFSPTSLLKE